MSISRIVLEELICKLPPCFRPVFRGVQVVRSNPPFWLEPPFLIEFPIENVEFTTSRWNSNPPFSIERTPVLKTSNRLPRIDKTSPTTTTPPRIDKTSPTTPPLELIKLIKCADYPPPLELIKLRRLPPLGIDKTAPTTPLELIKLRRLPPSRIDKSADYPPSN